MHPFLLYFVKTLICSGILLGYYWAALRNKVFHHYNRFYLLAAVVLSLMLPLIKINFWQEEQAALPVIQLLQAANMDGGEAELVLPLAAVHTTDWTSIAWYLYAFTSAVLLLLILHGLRRIYLLYRNNERQQSEGISIIHTVAKGTPFSFFNCIFWNRQIDLQSTTGQQILKHEIAHVQQRHSLDKLCLNLVLIPFWCNPFFWMIRRELNIIHEFLADKLAVENQDSSQFAMMLLQAAYPQHRFEMGNSFFYSPIKRRLMMLTKNTQSKAGYISRLLALPLMALVFVAFTFKAKSTVAQAPVRKPVIVVVDAGHGGKDFGARGRNVYEKDITLKLALKIKELNTDPNLQIILSRETDIYQSPPEKAAFINEQKADFAVSVHVDAEEEDALQSHSGMSFWVAKDEYPNSAASKILASTLIQSIESSYPFPVGAMPGQKQVGIWILKATKCPTVLVEVGYMTHNKNLAYLNSSAGIETTARNLLNGMARYASEKDQLAALSPSVQANQPVAATGMNNANVSTGQNASSKKDTTVLVPNKLVVVNGKIKGDYDNPEIRSTINALDVNQHGAIKQINILSATEGRKKYGAVSIEGVIEIEHETKPTIATTEKKHNESWRQKAIVIANGRIIGTVQELAQRSKGMFAAGDFTADVNFLEPKEAIAKYGKAASNGAYELRSYSIHAMLDKPAWPGAMDPLWAEKNAPLYVIDGSIAASKLSLDALAPASIDKIDILKGEAATKKYGDAGKNGVIEVTTKGSAAPAQPAG